MANEMVVLNMDRLRHLTPIGGTVRSSTGRREIWKKHSIYRVPISMKNQNPEDYVPQLVSIGPFHCGQHHLAAMEEHKERALQQFLYRSNKTIDVYCEALRPLVADLMDTYQQLDKGWRDRPEDFLKLMILDGSFLYEFLCGCSEGWDYDALDPVFSFEALLNICPYLVPDILMIENQLPLIVIERLIAVETGKLDEMNDARVHELVFKFLSCPEPFPNMTLGLHVLDVSRKVIARGIHNQSVEEREPAIHVESATELSNAGVEFRVSGTRGVDAVSFTDGILKFPLWRFDSTTEPLFLNAIAFERLHPSAGREVSSYVAFMQGLINSAADVSILKRKGLIECTIGSDEDVIVHLMNKISRNVFFDPRSNLCQVRDSVNQYYERKMKTHRRRLREWRRQLKQTYFSNPWSLISVIAAVSLLIMTLIQTIYIVLSYNIQRRS